MAFNSTSGPAVAPAPEAPARLRQAIASAASPIGLKALAKQIKLPVPELSSILVAEEQRGAVFRWPAVRGQVRFWHRSPDAVARERILKLASESAMPVASLAELAKRDLTGYPMKLVTATVQQLIREKELQAYPGLDRPKGGKALIGRTGYPSAYATAARSIVSQIFAKLTAAGAGPAHLRMAIPDLAKSSDPEALDLDILEAIAKIEPAGTAPVSVRELRDAVAAPKQAFDRAALRLRQARRVYFSEHDFPQGLPPAERELLIDGGDGRYYVAIAARRE